MKNANKQPRKNLWEIFKDDNDINEKAVIGFISFGIMVTYSIIDLTSAYLGKELHLREYIYQSFVSVTIGSFAVAGAEKIFRRKHRYYDPEDDSDEQQIG